VDVLLFTLSTFKALNVPAGTVPLAWSKPIQ